ncbi:MAG: hypothetical protein ABI200_07540 [Gaiellales bacterium]
MSNNERREQAAMPPDGATRERFAGPRLELPRFQFAPSSSPRTPMTPAASTAAPTSTPRRPSSLYQPRPWPQPQPTAKPQPQPQPHAPHAPAPTWQATATAPQQPMQVSYAAPVAAPAPVPSHAPAHAPIFAPLHQQHQHHAPTQAAQAIAAASATRPSTISWERLHEPAGERTLLQRIKPVHAGALMVMVMIAMIVTSGPATMTATPARLPALAATTAGGGIDGMNPRAGAAALEAATAEGTKTTKPLKRSAKRAPAATAKTTARAKRTRAGAGTGAGTSTGTGTSTSTDARLIHIGNATLKSDIRSGGIPSAAAGANLLIAGGGQVDASMTGAVQMNGIPSPAAGLKLSPETLPFTPDDGATMARTSGERDSHAVDTHYGAGTLPMEKPALPAMTPGAAAQQSERRVIRNELSGGTASMPAVNGGLINAY